MKHRIAFFSMIALLLALCGCEPRLLTAPGESATPTLNFTSQKIDLGGGEYIFRQEVQVRTELAGSSFAYRIYTLTGEMPVGTVCDGEGFILHYQPGADTSIPLGSPDALQGIWTGSQALARDFGSVDGRLENLITRVKVMVKSASGQLVVLDSGFKSDRIIGTRIRTNFINGATVGQGIEALLQEQTNDVYVDGLYAGHFMFRLNILDASLNPVTYGAWHNSLEMEDLRKLIINAHSNPQLAVNAANQFTQLQVYVVTRQGLEEQTPKSVYFRVGGQYCVQSLIYQQLLFANGQHHYSSLDAVQSPGQAAMPPWQNRKWLPFYTWEGESSAVNSPDLKVHLAWGWNGQYGHTAATGTPIITNDPFDTELNLCVDASTGTSYYSAIRYFDLRLNGQPFPNLAQFGNTHVVTHSNGSSWLRVPKAGYDSQHAAVYMPDGLNTFEVMAIDGQDNDSSIPAVTSFHLYPFKPQSSRSGILILDCDPDNSLASPEAVVDAFYTAVCPTHHGPVDAVDVFWQGAARQVPTSLLQNYKYVLLHADNPSSSLDLLLQSDALRFFNFTAGFLIVSSTNQLCPALQALSQHHQTYAAYLELQDSQSYGIVSSSFTSNPYLIGAEDLGIFGVLGDIDLNLGTPFNTIVLARMGLGTVTYFQPYAYFQALYGFMCKPVGAATFPPTQAQYDFYSSTNVAVHPDGSFAFLFGFPLSYMEQSDVQFALGNLIDFLAGN